MTQWGGTAAKAILTPGDLGGGTEKVLCFFCLFVCLFFRWRWGGGGGGGLYLFIFWEREARASRFSSHSLERWRVRERRRPPGFGSRAGGSRWLRIPEFPPQLRRPGNVRLVSGAGAGPGGRKEHLSSPAPRSIPPQAGGFSRPGSGARFPIVLLEGAGEKGMRGGYRKIQAPFLGLWGGVRATVPLTLKRGNDIFTSGSVL